MLFISRTLAYRTLILLSNHTLSILFPTSFVHVLRISRSCKYVELLYISEFNLSTLLAGQIENPLVIPRLCQFSDFQFPVCWHMQLSYYSINTITDTISSFYNCYPQSWSSVSMSIFFAHLDHDIKILAPLNFKQKRPTLTKWQLSFFITWSFCCKIIWRLTSIESESKLSFSSYGHVKVVSAWAPITNRSIWNQLLLWMSWEMSGQNW